MTKVAELQIEMSANVARLSTDMQAAREEVKKGTHGIMGHISEMQKGIQEHSERIKKSLEVFKVLSEFGGLAEVGAKIIELGKSAAEYGDQIEQASQKTGVSTTALQGLKFAAEQSDVSFQNLQTGLFHLSRAMATAGQGNNQMSAAFRSLGIHAAQLKNMSIDQVLMKVSDAFSKSHDGAAKTAIAMQLFGRSGAEMIPFLNKGSTGIDEMTTKAKSLGLILNDQAIAKDAEFNDSLKQLGTQLNMAAVGFGSALTPAIKGITDAMSQSLQPGGLLSDTLKALASAIKYLVLGLELAWQSLETVTAAMAGAIVTVAGVIKSALHLDWSGVKSAWNRGLTETKLAVNQQVGDMMHTILAFKGELLTVGESKPQITGSLSMPSMTHSRGGSMHGHTSEMSTFRAELQHKQDLEGASHQISKQEELAFWQQKLSVVQKGTADYNAVLHQVVTLQRQVDHERITASGKAASAELGQKVQMLNTERGMELAHLQQVKANNQFLLQTGQISNAEKLARDQNISAREYTLELTLLSKKLTLYQEDAKNRAKIDDQIIKLNDQRNAQIIKANQATVLATQKSWQGMLSPVTSAFDTSIKGMIMGTTTWQKATHNLLQSIVGEFVSSAVHMAVQWAANEAIKTTATLAAIATRHAAEQGANSQGLAASAITVVKAIMNDAAKAFSGVFAALSGIPYVGPVLAAGAAPAAMATVAGIAGSVASSAGGAWQIPADRLNFVHKNETILPADKAQGLDQLINGGGSPTTTTHVHIHATDAQSVERLFRNNGAALAAALKTHLRNFGG